MAHFYGAIQGQAGEATRCGSKRSGIDAYVQSEEARITVVEVSERLQLGQLAIAELLEAAGVPEGDTRQ